MRSTWPIVWGCLCALLATGKSAVLSKKDALVIVKPNYNPETIAEAAPQTTTEAPLAPVKVLELQVKCKISLRYAHTTVTSLVKNPAPKSQQHTFNVITPETAFISGFKIVIGGIEYKAYVKEKEEAKQIYNDAVSQGLGAGHVATMVRDSNHFSVDINIPSNVTVLFNLVYEELLTRVNGLYKFSANMNPGTLVSRYSLEVHIRESQKINKLKVPEITNGNEIIPTDSNAQNTKAVITRAADDREAKITFTPNIDQQKILMDIFAQKAKESEANAHRQFYLDGDSKSEGNMGQFTVLYDVDRNVSEMIVVDGYFAHFVAPENLSPLPKFCVMVMDTSGSMSGIKIEQLRKALTIIVEDLHFEDYFSLVEFASGVKVHNIDDAHKPAQTKPSHYVFYEREQSPKLLPPYKATPENKAKAKIIIERLSAQGGTNIAGALSTAIDLIQKGIFWTEDVSNVTEPVTATEHYTTEANHNDKESKAIKPKPKPEKDNVKNGLNSYQPIIIFLTDGEPTVGETNPKRITNNVIEKNYGEKAASIFSLAFGNGADRTFLRRMALQNRGYMRQIYEGGDATMQIIDFYKTIAIPTLENVTFVYPANQVKKTTKNKYRTYFEGMEMVVAGKVDPSTTDITSLVSGFCGVEDGVGKKRYEIRPKVIIPKKENEDDYLPLERLFAYLTIKQQLEEIEAAEDLDKPKEVKDKLRAETLDLALKYSFVTPLSSLVVVLPNSTSTVNPESLNGKPSSAQYASGSSQLSAANFAPLAFRGGSSPLAAHSSNSKVARRPVMKSSVSRVSSSPIAHHQPAQDATHDVSQEVKKPANTLNTFHLENYSWTLPHLDLNAGEFKVQENGVSTILKLSKDANVPQSSSPCGRAINGAPGDCLYLTRCEAAQNITYDQYLSTYHCKVDGGYAGVCCPKASDSETAIEIQPTQSNCDAESTDQTDNADNTSDNAEIQTSDTSDDTDLNDTKNDEGEIVNDEEDSGDTDSNDDETVNTNSEDVDSTDSTDGDPIDTNDENVTHCIYDVDNQKQITNDDS